MSLAYMVQIFFFDIFFFSCPWPTWVRHLEPHRAEGQSSSLHGVFYANFGKVRRPAASTGWAPDRRDRCWVRPLSCAKVLAESDQAFGREGRIADPRRQEPDVIGNATTPQIGGFYANFGKVRRPAASTGWAPDRRDRCWVRPLSCAKVLAESDQAFGREGRIADPRRQEPDVIGNATTPQIGGFYANFGKVRRPAASTGRAPDHRERCWVRPLSCAKDLTESHKALDRERRIADPHRQEPEDSGLCVIFDIRAHASQMYQHPRGHRSQGPLLGMSSVLY